MHDITVRWIDQDSSIRHTVYRTTEVVANVSAQALRSRATRVWRGREVDKNGDATGDLVVIKDCWVDDERPREGDTLAAIEDAARASKDVKHEARFHKYFLHVVCHGDVYVDGKKDNTLTLMRNSTPLPSCSKSYELKTQAIGSRRDDWNARENARLDEGNTKTHYRIVFREYGMTIDKLTSMKKICKALHEANTGMQLRCIIYLYTLAEHPYQDSRRCMSLVGSIEISVLEMFL